MLKPPGRLRAKLGAAGVRIGLVVGVVAASTLQAAGASSPRPLIAFATTGDGTTGALDIAVAAPDGSAYAKVTHNRAQVRTVRYTSDGGSIVYWAVDRFTGLWTVWRERRDGSDAVRLWGSTMCTWELDDCPTPSPDGRLVADWDGRNVEVANATGGRVRLLPVAVPKHAENWGAGLVWSPDARWIAVGVWTESAASDVTRTWLLRVDGTQTRALSASTSYERPVAFSPNSKLLLTRGRNNAFVTSIDGRRRVSVRGDLGGAASWSTDSKRFAYIGGHGVYVTNAYTGRRRLVGRLGPTRNPGLASVAWAPDKDLIAFSREDGLYLVRADGGGMTRLTSQCVLCEVSWDPRGQAAVFASGGTAYRVSLVSHRQTVLLGPAYDADTPVWSPDRTRIAFTLGSPGLRDPKRLWVYVVRADGSGAQRIGRGYGPQWAPDSRRLVYVNPLDATETKHEKDDAGAIVVADLGGSSLRVATGSYPRWLPDGETIGFVRNTFGKRYDDSTESWYETIVATTVSTVGADGARERVVLASDASRGAMRNPRWAPDGSTVAFEEELASGTNDQGETAYRRHFALLDVANGATRTLTVRPDAEWHWSPDSTQLLFPLQQRILALDVATKALRVVVRWAKSVRIKTAAWSPDGSAIAYTRCRWDTDCDVYSVHADGSHPRRVTRTAGIEGALAWAP